FHRETVQRIICVSCIQSREPHPLPEEGLPLHPWRGGGRENAPILIPDLNFELQQSRQEPSYVQNRNRHGANDCVAMDPQVTAVRVALGNQQIRLRLLRRLAQHLRHVTIADEYVRLDAHVLLKLCEMLRSVTDQRFFPLWNDVTAARSPKLHPGSNVGECKTGTEFGGHLRGPRHSFVTPGAEIDRAEDIADRKLLPWRFFHVGAGPNRALGPV